MDVNKFRLDWKSSPAKQLDALAEMVKHLSNMANQLTDISAKLAVLPEINNNIEAGNLLLQQISDNTQCACNALTDVNEKLDEIIDILEDVPPAAIYEFVNNTESHEVSELDLINNYIDLSGSSLKDSVLFDSVTILDCPAWLNPVVSVLDGILRLSIIPSESIPAGNFVLQMQQAESNIIQEVELYYSDVVEIAGIQWRKGLLVTDSSDATGMTSIFARKMSDYGSYYQWGRKKSWNVGAVSDWDSSVFSGSWQSVNSPVPSGFRLPETSDLTSLVSSGGIYRPANSIGNPMPVFVFGPNFATATFGDMQGCLFVSPSGMLNTVGSSSNVGVTGFIWSGTVQSPPNSLFFNSASVANFFARSSANGLCLLCIKGSAPVEHTLLFDTGDGDTYGGGSVSGNYEAGRVMTLPTYAERAGYEFAGYTSSLWSGIKHFGDTFVMPDYDLTVVLTWSLPIISIFLRNAVADGNNTNASLMLLPPGIDPAAQGLWISGTSYDVAYNTSYEVDKTGLGANLSESQDYYLWYKTVNLEGSVYLPSIVDGQTYAAVNN